MNEKETTQDSAVVVATADATTAAAAATVTTTTAATDDTAADAAFAHLEELVAGLAAIQAKDDLLARAREARELTELRDRARMLEAEIGHYQQVFKQALSDAKRASDAGDREQEGRNLGLVRMYSELESTRTAPMQRAQNALRQKLKSSSLSLEDPLEDYALSDEEFEALGEAIESFRKDYRETYELCLRIEAAQ